jgi:hypothetical protein
MFDATKEDDLPVPLFNAYCVDWSCSHHERSRDDARLQTIQLHSKSRNGRD